MRKSMKPASASVEGIFEGRELGSIENLFLPRRSLSTCALPATVHVCVAVLERQLNQEAIRRGLELAVAKHALLRARIVGNGVPPARGPLGAPLADAGALRHALAPFGDDNMRLGLSQEPLRFEPTSIEDVVSAATEPSVTLGEDHQLDEAWQSGFKAALNAKGGEHLFDSGGQRFEFNIETGPLWRCKTYHSEQRTAVLLGFNHAISDQPSAAAVLDDIVRGAFEEQDASIVAATTLPPSLESAILGKAGTSRGFGRGLLGLDKGSLRYLVAKALESCVDPLFASPYLPNGLAARFADHSLRAANRTCDVVFATLEPERLDALKRRAREERTTIGSVLAAAAALAFASVASSPCTKPVKVLQSLDMRRFGNFESRTALACHAGSFDVLLSADDDLWALARSASQQLTAFIEADFGVQSVRVFDWATDAMEMARLVELEADNPITLGRAYACGISNAGIYQPVDEAISHTYYATSNTYSGSAIQAYVVTVNGSLDCCFEASLPVVELSTLRRFADVFIEVLRSQAEPSRRQELSALVTTNGVVAGALGASVSFALHAPAWAAFGEAVGRAASAANSLADLIAPFGFWLFFAIMHPLIGSGGVGLGELLWSFPGYADTANLDASGPPIAFIVASLLVTRLALATRASRAALAALAVFGLADYVGAGLDGTSPDIASYNLALDDGAKGCPAYNEIASKSMAGFDVTRYQGLWYEHAYHDWTQFSEVYDTSLDIKLAKDRKTWYDAFAVKGPSPAVAPRSWRGSPVANGALYPLYGTLDAKMTPGSLLEKGFGNVFPNYIIDVVRDKATGDYTEAIQFQCLQAGGVRVFEGINFLTRSPEISSQQLDAMFDRAKAIAPYGATRDQMHIVLHVPDFKPIQNWWQDAWVAVGLDKLLALIAADL